MLGSLFIIIHATQDGRAVVVDGVPVLMPIRMGSGPMEPGSEYSRATSTMLSAMLHISATCLPPFRSGRPLATRYESPIVSTL